MFSCRYRALLQKGLLHKGTAVNFQLLHQKYLAYKSKRVHNSATLGSFANNSGKDGCCVTHRDDLLYDTLLISQLYPYRTY